MIITQIKNWVCYIPSYQKRKLYSYTPNKKLRHKWVESYIIISVLLQTQGMNI